MMSKKMPGYMKSSFHKTGVSDVANKIVIDTSQVNKIVKGLGKFEKQMPGAFVSAVNRTMDHVYTRTGRLVTKHYNVTVREIKDSMTKHKANYNTKRAWIQVRSKRYTISRFLPGGLNSKSKIAKVKIEKAAGYKIIGGNPKAFTRKVNGGNTHVFRRRGKKRFPLDIIRTISPTQMVENKSITEEIQSLAGTKLSERINHEINYRLKKVSVK
jgi:hypothetical protein